jgi:hypothetical protein
MSDAQTSTDGRARVTRATLATCSLLLALSEPEQDSDRKSDENSQDG